MKLPKFDLSEYLPAVRFMIVSYVLTAVQVPNHWVGACPIHWTYFWANEKWNGSKAQEEKKLY